MATLTKTGVLLRDTALRYQVLLERLKANEARKLDPVLKAFDKLVRETLASAPKNMTPAQVNGMLRQMHRTSEAIFGKFNENAMVELKRISAHATKTHESIASTAWPDSAPALISPSPAAVWQASLHEPIQATGQLLEPFVEGWSRRTMERVEGAIRNGYARGQTTDEILRIVHGTKSANFSDGIIGGISRREGRAMVNTAIQQTSNAAQMAVYEANKETITGYQFVATLDSHTTEQCMALDGQKFVMGEGPVPPLHVNCRSITIPVIKGVDLSEGRTRASSGADGGEQVSGRLSYFEWLKSQPASFQDEALGSTRGALFRRGGLSADEFARLNLGRDFQPLTLEQMRQKDPAAFSRAGI